MSQETPMEQMKRFADNQLIIGDRFKITYYSTSDGEEITRIGRWDEKSTFRTSKAGDKLMIYYDEEKQGYRTAKNEWKLEFDEIIKNEKATKNPEEDKKMSENTVSPIFKFYRPKSNRFINEVWRESFWRTKEALLQDFPDTPLNDIQEYTGEEIEVYFETNQLDTSKFISYGGKGKNN